MTTPSSTMVSRCFGAVVFLLLVEAGACFLSVASPLIGPAPMPLIAPMLAVPFPLVLAVPLLIFWGWTRALRSGASIPPMRTWILFLATGLLSAVWFLRSWNFGLRYQGAAYTATAAGLSTLLGVTVLVLLLGSSERSTPSRSLVTQTLLFAWILSYAIPWLGESP